jgi:predicted double-glycine peptidase/uncharacterized membrane protein
LKKFRLLMQTRQHTEYSCGASALQAVMHFWGKSVDEEDLMVMLGTTPEEGTYPEDMVRVARSQGLEAELRANLTIDDVARVTARGEPVIVLGQAWRSQNSGATSMADDWDDGHWFIVLGVDDEYVYVEDPYARMGKGFQPREAFEERWHNVMGGDRSKPEQIHMGIFIRGDQPASARPYGTPDYSAIDSSQFGSLTLTVVEFAGQLQPYDFYQEVKSTLNSDIVQVLASIFLYKDAKGRLTALEAAGIEQEDDAIEINAVLGYLMGLAGGSVEAARLRAQTAAKGAAQGDFGLSEQELWQIAAPLAAGNSAMILIFDNLWERKLREAAAKYAGKVIREKRIGASELAQLGQELRSGD